MDLRLIEADQVTPLPISFFDLPRGLSTASCLIAFGNPVEYHVLKQHPGDLQLVKHVLSTTIACTGDSRSSISSAAIGQAKRGAFPTSRRRCRYSLSFAGSRLAVLAAAETAADFAGILYTDAPANGEADSAEPFEPIELEQRALLTMPGGWKMSQLRAEQPSTSHSEFVKQILNEIARCLNMPFNVASGNSAGYNYASGRLDHQIYFKSLRVEQAHIEAVVLDRILAAWLDEAVLIEGFLPSALRTRDADFTHQWFWDGREHVDPAKEANAQATRLAGHTTTLANEYAKQGRDWEAELHQRAKEVRLIQELGLTTSDVMSANEEERDEDEAEEQEDFPQAAA